MKKHHKYFYYKSLMMSHLAFASENVSMDDSLFHLFFYHVYKDKAQAVYFSMSHEEHKVLHELMVL